MADQCPRFGKWVRGCRFEARYSVTPPEKLSTEDFRGTITSWNAMVASMSTRTYEGDVCVRCGKRSVSAGSANGASGREAHLETTSQKESR